MYMYIYIYIPLMTHLLPPHPPKRDAPLQYIRN